jgi:GNAT superfamily N-acetyltransferase
MIRECTAADAERIHFVINEAAQAYKGVIPDDCWHEPYMPLADLRREMREMTFFGWCEDDGQDARPTQDARATPDGELVGVMGYQPLGEVTLVRHAYVLPERQGEGIGGRLLAHLKGMSTGRLLVGTWTANAGAVRFYERHGFRLLADGQELLRRYWNIPQRQRETSLVLGMEV